MRTKTRSLCSKMDGLVLNHSNTSSKWVWLPMNGDTININRMLIQIEAAAQDIFQAEASKSISWLHDSDAVFRKIANDMINEKTDSETKKSAPTKENKVNTAKADTRG